MNRKWIAAIATVLALSAGLTAALSAAPQDRGRGARRFGRIPSRRLGLTDRQKQQMKSVAQAHREERTSLRQRLAAARMALREATTATPIDEALVRQRRADLSAVRADAAVQRARVRSEMIQVLTPEQQSQLKTFQDEMRHRRQRR
jgi:periplasmic protein CpxP/Spy